MTRRRTKRSTSQSRLNNQPISVQPAVPVVEPPSRLKYHPVIIELFDFLKRLDAVFYCLDLYATAAEMMGKDEVRNINTLLSQHGIKIETDGRTRYRLEYKYAEPLLEKINAHDRLTEGIKIASKQIVVALVSQYDAYIYKLLRLMFQQRPEKLLDSKKTVTYEDIVKADSIETIRDNILDEEIDLILRKSRKEQLEIIANLFDVKIEPEKDLLAAFVELTERRNLFVHTDGIVNREYIKKCSATPGALQESIQESKELTSNRKYAIGCFHTLVQMSVFTSIVLLAKHGVDAQRQIDSFFIEYSYKLIKRKHFELASKLLEFTQSRNYKPSSIKDKMYILLNLAQAYKWQGNQEKCSSILADADFSACGSLLKMVRAVLMDDFAAASTFMRSAVGTSEISLNEFRLWPVFTIFRSTQEFSETYQELAGVAYEHSAEFLVDEEGGNK